MDCKADNDFAGPLKSIVIAAKHNVAPLAFNLQRTEVIIMSITRLHDNSVKHQSDTNGHFWRLVARGKTLSLSFLLLTVCSVFQIIR